MPFEVQCRSLANLRASAAFLALAIVCWPALISAQTILAPQIGIDQPFNVAPTSAGAAAQQETFLELTDWARRALGKLTQLSSRGGLEPLTAKEKNQLANVGILSAAQKFRVGMFVEYVTENMLTLYRSAGTGAKCTADPALSQQVEKELAALEQLQKGRVNGTVFGPKAMKDRCTKG